MAGDLKELRRSAVVSIHGPGAVVDFRADNAPVSGVAAGLEEWDNSFPPIGLRNPQTIHEERLEKKLNVRGFRVPPVVDDRKGKPDLRRLVAVRFPIWLQCPQCNFLKPEGKWSGESGSAARYCAECTNENYGERVFVVPVRFVLACEHGHLDEFPWDQWVGHKPGCENRQRGLILKSESPGLAGLILSCPTCKERRSMDGIFSKQTWKNMRSCAGKKPWLSSGPDKCDQTPVAVQRGASNMYFPVVESALSIPPWSDHLQETLGNWWNTLANIEDTGQRELYITMTQDLEQPLEYLGMSAADLSAAVEERLQQYNDINIEDLRPAEYDQFVQNPIVQGNEIEEFEIRREVVPESAEDWISHIVRVVRLREVRALKGFTRIRPPDEGANIMRLSENPLEWLPALEVRGEGIFIGLNVERLRSWEENQTVLDRIETCNKRYQDDYRSRFGAEAESNWEITPRYVLCHSFAHALMRQLTLECGYSAASLGERIYAGYGDKEMAGLLIYTATTDADGTLGGLQRQGKASRILGIIDRALKAIEWCSSDPLCITDSMGALASYSHSTCHSCLLAPETSCESFNHYLDRGLLTGLPDERDVGYFEGFGVVS